MSAMQDPARLEIFKHLLNSVAEEMGVTLRRGAYSPNIKERLDFSCALFDRNGNMVSHAAHIPVHLGAMPLSIRASIRAVEFLPGDVIIMNDPYQGGTHLPDITLITPVFESGKLFALIANRAHHSDVGGISPGSMPLSTNISEEGLLIHPIKLVESGEVDQDVLDWILDNVRTPQERSGDLRAQIAANLRGVERVTEFMSRYGPEDLSDAMLELLLYSERMTRRLIAEIPDGVYSYSDFMDDDGVVPEAVEICVTVTIDGDEAKVDFSGTASQCVGSINATLAVTVAATLYVFRCLLGIDIPSNSGCLVPISIIAPEGSLVNARAPSAVAAGNVETVGGGMGARPGQDGADAIHTHMTNTLNTPVEALEYAYPIRVRRYAVRRGSGGTGLYTGGDGIVREIEFLNEARVTILSDRRKIPPYGLEGGGPGKTGINLLVCAGEEQVLPGKTSVDVQAGDIISLRSPGGGGWGSAT